MDSTFEPAIYLKLLAYIITLMIETISVLDVWHYPSLVHTLSAALASCFSFAMASMGLPALILISCLVIYYHCWNWLYFYSSLSGRKWSSWVWLVLWFWSSSSSSYSHRHSETTPISVTPPTRVIYPPVAIPVPLFLSLIPAREVRQKLNTLLIRHCVLLSCPTRTDGRFLTPTVWKRAFV